VNKPFSKDPERRTIAATVEIPNKSIQPVVASPVPEKNALGLWGTLAFGLVIGITALAAQSFAGFTIGLLKAFSKPGMDSFALGAYVASVAGLILSTGTVASAIAGIGIMAIVVRARTGRSLADYVGLDRLKGKTVLLGLIVAIASIIAMDGLTTLLHHTASDFMIKAYDTSVWPVLLWIAVVVFAPAFEEVFFRGFLFEGLRRSRIGAVGTVTLTSLLWAALHVQYGFFEIAMIFGLGIVLGVVRIRTGSLWSTLVIHAFVNLVATYQTAAGMSSLFG